MVLIALSSIKANKSELNTILKQGDTLIIESRKTNNLLTKIVNDTIR